MIAMSATGIVISQEYEQHDTGHHHPERSARIHAINTRLAESGLLKETVPIAPVEADNGAISRVHPPDYIERLSKVACNGSGYIDTMECPVSRRTPQIARLAAGGLLAAVDAVMAGQLRNAFCAVRPPGHHAERSRAMGFCYFNNIAIAAEYLLARHGLDRVAVLDWDVHHGNGTQHHFEENSRVLFSSIHQHPDTLFPGTGYPGETGLGPGAGMTLNVAMYPRQGDDDYRRAFEEQLLPAIEAFEPRFLLVSAGFDAHRNDPLANIELSTEMFGWMTQRVAELARRLCDGRVVSVLEGGYDLQALADSVEQHVAHLVTADKPS